MEIEIPLVVVQAFTLFNMIEKLVSEFLDFGKILLESEFVTIYSKIKRRFIDRKISLPPSNVLVSDLSENNTVDWGLDKLGVELAWTNTQGEGIKVAVLDTGMALQHPDLKDAIVLSVDLTTDRNPMDLNGHGSHVSGTVGSRNTHGYIIGVAPKCQLYSGKVLNAAGSGDFEWITQGVRWAISQKVDIINMSLGCDVPYQRLHDAIIDATNAGIIVIAASGNEGSVQNKDTMGYPARYPEVIAVGAVDQNMNRSWFSSEGPELCIMAPGSQIYSCWPPDKYAMLQGTSMASPFCTGICALILSEHRKKGTPINNYKDMRDYLKKIAKNSNGTWTPDMGWGILDASKIPNN